MTRNTFWSTPRFNTRPTSFSHSHVRPFLLLLNQLTYDKLCCDTTPYVCLEDIDLIIEKLEVKAIFNDLMKI